LKIRYAAKADREEILRFCVNTFDWGDYIDQVWDLWYSDRDGSLLVVEDDDQVYGIHKDKRPSVIALGHASLCPNKKSVWLEGIRVNPNYRRRSIATGLLNEMISYGKEKGATQASAIVADNNIASKSMMERNGFTVISKWNYFSTDKIHKRAKKVGLTSRVASGNDAEMITNYLRQSFIYKASGGAYVNSWRWYFLDLYSNTLTDLIDTDRILINGNGQIEGLAIINRPANNCNIYNKNDNKNRNRDPISLQIVYIDTTSSLILKDLVSFAINLIHSDGVLCDKIQVYIPQASFISAAMDQVGLEVSEQFLLYKKEI
jgi:ribosomal protein S18 acetylase RimI-like enzyme